MFILSATIALVLTFKERPPKTRESISTNTSTTALLRNTTRYTTTPAAVAIYTALEASGIKFGIFGGYAVSVLGGNRESKDVDCIVSASKQEILRVLDGKNGFTAIPQTREDYVAFLWSEHPAVLVEIFCARFPGERATTHHQHHCTAQPHSLLQESPPKF